mgnify:CR=1 FL=1
MLDGRVKTLHPKIHASLLFKRNIPEHFATFKKLNFPIIDFVIVNLYSFEKTINNKIQQQNTYKWRNTKLNIKALKANKQTQKHEK